MKNLNLSLLLLFCIQISHSQIIQYADGSSQSMSNVFVNINSNENSNIKGSKYINETFISTKISSMPGQIFGVRYNVFSDEMEFQGIDNKIYALNKNDVTVVVTFTETNDSYYIFNYLDDNNIQKKGYFKKLNSKGANLLLKKNRIVFFEEQASKTGYDAPKPAMYKTMKDRIYIKLGDNDAVLMPTKKSKLAKQIFPDNEKEVLKFIKSNKIKLKNEEDLNKLVEFTQTL